MNTYAKKLANSLSYSRPLIGLIVAWQLFQGHFSAGFAWYLIGNITDVLDGTVARAGKCTSPEGVELDRKADAVFNTLSTAGYVMGAMYRNELHWAIGLVAATFGLVAVTRWVFGFESNSGLSKLRSGVIRGILMSFMLVKLSWTALDLALMPALAVLAPYAAYYELKVTIEEVRLGKRRWFKSPPTPAQ